MNNSDHVCRMFFPNSRDVFSIPINFYRTAFVDYIFSSSHRRALGNLTDVTGLFSGHRIRRFGPFLDVGPKFRQLSLDVVDVHFHERQKGQAVTFDELLDGVVFAGTNRPDHEYEPGLSRSSGVTVQISQNGSDDSILQPTAIRVVVRVVVVVQLLANFRVGTAVLDRPGCCFYTNFLGRPFDGENAGLFFYSTPSHFEGRHPPLMASGIR
mmetsp:Transcript_32000/g.63391  ORF Transcript_32000/g.63391 Transcript_32000/m.63391 type:complete len:211 (+) Transcript_32000:1196-1828(+)